MTKQHFLEAALAGKREADLFVGHTIDILGGQSVVSVCAGCGVVNLKDVRKGKHSCGHSVQDMVKPYATCPDSSPESGQLFWEMFNLLPREGGYRSWIVADSDGCCGRFWTVSHVWAIWQKTVAKSRCLAAALALCEAQGAFEEEKP